MNELVLSEVMTVIIVLIGFIIARDFYISRNGILRKILIWYFIVEVFVYSLAFIYWLDVLAISVGLFRLIVLVPKFIIKLRLLWYLKTKR